MKKWILFSKSAEPSTQIVAEYGRATQKKEGGGDCNKEKEVSEASVKVLSLFRVLKRM